jgi:hypothetical protein
VVVDLVITQDPRAVAEPVLLLLRPHLAENELGARKKAALLQSILGWLIFLLSIRRYLINGCADADDEYFLLGGLIDDILG